MFELVCYQAEELCLEHGSFKATRGALTSKFINAKAVRQKSSLDHTKGSETNKVGADVNDERGVEAEESSLVDPNKSNTTTSTSSCFHLIKKEKQLLESLAKQRDKDEQGEEHSNLN